MDIFNGRVSGIINQFLAKSVNDDMRRSASLVIELLHIKDNMLTLNMLSDTEILFVIDYQCMV